MKNVLRAPEPILGPREWLEISCRSWPQFTADLFADAPISGRDRLPIRLPQLLAGEAVDAVAEIIRRGTLGYLFGTCGWRALKVIPPGGGAPKLMRLWEHSGASGLKLDFSERSIDLALALFNVAGTDWRDSSSPSYDWLSQLKPATPGDMLAFFAINRARLLAKAPEPWHDNLPSTVLSPLALPTKYILPIKRANGLVPSWLEFALPWLGAAWCRDWLRQEGEKWGSLKAFRLICPRQQRLMEYWLAEARDSDRPQLLIPLLEFYRGYTLRGLGGAAGDRLTSSWAGDRQQDRDATRDAFMAAVLEPFCQLESFIAEVAAIHPYDREPRHRLLLEACTDLHFDETAAAMRALAERLRPTIG